MRTGNPVLNDKTFELRMTGSEVMTINGTVNKTFILFFLLLLPASWSWTQFMNSPNPAAAYPWIIGGSLLGLVIALITVFNKPLAPYLAPAYAICKGLVVGAISATYEALYDGIVLQAIALTMGVLFSLLLAYKTRVIKVTENFKLGVIAATGAIFLVYLVNIALSFFGMSIPYLHDSGPVGIGISVVIVIVAALNLVLDFDFIENGAARGAPKYMEWYGAFGLMVTLIWLYLEILRLLAKMRR